MDILHTCMVFASNWIYLMNHYGDSAIDKTIPWYGEVSSTLCLSDQLTEGLLPCVLLSYRFYVAENVMGDR
jgi:hypothetical protein